MSIRNFLSASEFPWKVVKVGETLIENNLPPVHLQLYPTNRCNAKCSYCSCGLEDRSVEMPSEEIVAVLDHFKELGTRALTLSGGGEPTVHRDFPGIISAARRRGIEVGLATNGIRLARPGEREEENAGLTWCRVSILQTLTAADACELLNALCAKLGKVDLGVSLVVDETVDFEVAETVCRVARDTDITHVRFVQEIFNLEDGPMAELERRCSGITDKAFFQWRAAFKPGSSPCYMARIKPLVAASGEVFPCCGVQYAQGDDRHLPKKFSMGSWRAYGKDASFDGRGCVKCYYHEYNTALQGLTASTQHRWFL